MSSETAPAVPAFLDTRRFRRACSKFGTGVTVVTVLDDHGAPHGMTVNSFTSVSLAPVLILFCIDRKASILPFFEPGRPFGVNVLGEHQRELSTRFARPGEDRFGAIEWYAGESGAPLLPEVLATFDGAVRECIPAGDHMIVLGEVHSVEVREGRPLLYFNSNYETLGESLP